MLIRISLIVAILAGLGVAGIALFPLKTNIIQTQTDRDQFKKDWKTEQGEHRKFEKIATDTQKALDKTTKDLSVAKNDAAAAKAAEADAEKKAELAETTLKSTQQDLQASKDKLAAWDAIGLPIAQVRDTINSVRRITAEKEALEAEKSVIYAKTLKLQNKLDEIQGKNLDPELPDDLAGKVLAVDPKYDFVVVNVGTKQGALARGKLLVERNGKYIAKLVITEQIQSNQCVANVMPGYQLADVMEGDDVFPR